MKKFSGTKHGENPKEQMELERKRFKAKQKSREYSQQVKKEELMKSAEGNKKLPYFE